ncbi:endoribonuclease Dicer-like isoform X2 [Zootermopsis nevadensis]|nr:endoribonuclease Dicer-like isoform X2 [Zootermopsis nevadensis]XP_021927096.1 endoribonuclease Dicer-like isoform X2 [Zootermopsis nevadensis]XP_021927098.1 endoribonuclease Dicer-like isoform X2 [Zootermopsis nevadensis]
MEDDTQDDFKPRPYQELLMNLVKQQNTIIYLPTGSGKTFIAVMLIKELSPSLDRGKRSFFMVNTVALVSQQAAYIRRHSHHSVGEYSGDLNLDFWTKEVWQQELSQNQILVMTCQIFLNMLMHGYIDLSEINLLIFDECHHAVNDQPMRQVMQLFEHCPRELQPRILGLTATLLNSNCKFGRVKEEVRSLEKTFLSKVATCENMPVVGRYSTNPDEKVVFFDEEYSGPGLSILNEGLEYLKKAQNFVDCILFDSDEVVAHGHRPPNTTLLNTGYKKTNKKLNNILMDVIIHINMLGLFGGSQACVAHIIQLQRLRKNAEDKITKDVFSALITTLVAVRKMFEDEMSDYEVKTQIHKYSSHKMLKLIEVLKTAMPKDNLEDSTKMDDDSDDMSENYVSHHLACEKKGKENKFCTIVFVERRFTAKIVYLVLKALREEDKDFNHINPDFIVGFNNNPFNDTREGSLTKKWIECTVKRFLKGETNILVASDVLEEGIDIQKCNLVVKFDMPKNYRSYIQSKGRARHQSSKYYMMVSCSLASPFRLKYQGYTQTEKEVQNVLVGCTEERQEPEDEIATELYDHVMPPYVTTCSKVTLVSAITLINWYCSSLAQDKFTQLTPLWYMSKNKTSVHLQLPMPSPMRDIVEGPEMSTKKLAKRAAALETCRRLHQMGLLNEHLLPHGTNSDLLDSSDLFPLYVDEEQEDGPQPGSGKRKRYHPKAFPLTLSKCRPMEEVELYLHAIELRPLYPRPDHSNNRKLVFYNLLKRSDGFAILSSKMMPKLCDFSIYMNVGELGVHIENNAVRLQVTQNDVDALGRFNVMLFDELLKLMKPFMMVDTDNEENSYFVVPVRLGEDGCHEILWDIIRQNRNLPNILEPSVEERSAMQVTPELFQDSVVAPWYRGMMTDQSYIVTCVCPHLTPASPFPSEEYTSYEDYYKQKYKLSIINKDQPLLEVKAISNKINCLRPRSTKARNVTSKRKQQELQEDFEENLVAELCVHFAFPSVLWLKATCLPTILHRVANLLQAEELRQKIAREIGVGCTELPPGMEWKPLSPDSFCQAKEHEPDLAIKTASLIPGISSMQVSEPPNPLSSTLFDWDGDKEPVDIDRNMQDVTLVEVLNYDDFISKPLSKKFAQMSLLRGKYSPCNSAAVRDDEPECDVQIAILNTSMTGTGPEQCEILQALTSASANDIVNLERLETLGDSFLKLMSSLLLFTEYKLLGEGQLTEVKGKIIGNRNLYYCGIKQNLGGIMKVHDFGPTSDWIPPSMCLYRKLQQLMRSVKVSPNILYELQIPKEERLSGKLSRDTISDIENKLISADEDRAGIHSSMEIFLSIQTVSDKTIADGVEALIGAYLKGSGIRGALKLLGWLQVLPDTMASPERLLDRLPQTACQPGGKIEFHLEGIGDLERRLDYKFRDRSFLLQAVTHASYSANRATDCYQRLEFLGDAVLDFLITCHIYESCGLLTPGELTDLRSALVNNVTFASLTVRNGFHKFMKYTSPKLMDVVDSFVKFQEERNHVINEEVIILLEEEETNLAEAVEVPKVLGDLFESLAGAIYLDSGLNLQEVWRVYYRLMRTEIVEFSKCVPKQPVRLLYERAGQKPKFLPSRPHDDVVVVPVGVFINGKRRWFYGFGKTKTQAKRAAAKCALKELPPK